MAREAAKLLEQDAKWIAERRGKEEWKVRFKLHRKVWRKDEVIGRNDHIGRLKEATIELKRHICI
jgi:hypothetical protein